MQSNDSKNKSRNHPVCDNKDEGFTKLCDRDIRRVNDGLDETQVRSIITELTSQRDELAKKTEHISSLNKLAR